MRTADVGGEKKARLATDPVRQLQRATVIGSAQLLERSSSLLLLSESTAEHADPKRTRCGPGPLP